MKSQLYQLVFLLLFIFNISHAQTYIGVQSGFSVSKTPLRLDDELFTINQKSRHSVLYSISVEKKIKKNFYLQTEIQYSKEGSVLYKRDIEGLNFFYVFNDIKYIKVPLLAKYKLKFSDYLVYGLIGPSISVAVDGKSHFIMIDDRELNEQAREEIDFTKSGLSKVDTGVTFGVGLEKIIAKKVKLAVGFNYYFGLLNIGKNRAESIYNESQNFFIGASIPFTTQE